MGAKCGNGEAEHTSPDEASASRRVYELRVIIDRVSIVHFGDRWRQCTYVSSISHKTRGR